MPTFRSSQGLTRSRIPENVYFDELDANGPWPDGGDGSTDLFFIRRMAGCIKSWPEVYANTFRYCCLIYQRTIADEYRLLKPGDGWLEHTEIDFEPRCDTKPIPPQVRSIVDEFLSAMDEHGFTMRIDANNMKNGLQAAGYVDINEKALKLPLGDWLAEGEDSELARYLQLAVSKDLEWLFVGPLGRIKRRTLDEVREFAEVVRREITDIENQLYMKV